MDNYSMLSNPSVWASMQNQPVMPPPPGQMPDFSNPERKAYQVYASACVCLPLMLFFGAMRLYVKFAIIKSWEWDDGI
ncbi:uncharacterized protein KY384_004509 [Bacidia gigantensis]|uniref:uncharacterized protein n=1 Tax=Bacidia gigantensis TaxID=2732470 RepID=UPI001D036FFD|nr:uncharacterized protein KY384_004509 [Bacidia gigantensis]KAG8531151.1 hypothetical protein KY384_004509 [Bacidia gigantensis]